MDVRESDRVTLGRGDAPELHEEIVTVEMTRHQARMLVKLAANIKGTLIPETVLIQSPWLGTFIPVAHELAGAITSAIPDIDE